MSKPSMYIEYLSSRTSSSNCTHRFRIPKSEHSSTESAPRYENDDESELAGREDKSKRQKRERGQNKNRKFGKAQDTIKICDTVKNGETCSHGDQYVSLFIVDNKFLKAIADANSNMI